MHHELSDLSVKRLGITGYCRIVVRWYRTAGFIHVKTQHHLSEQHGSTSDYDSNNNSRRSSRPISSNKYIPSNKPTAKVNSFSASNSRNNSHVSQALLLDPSALLPQGHLIHDILVLKYSVVCNETSHLKYLRRVKKISQFYFPVRSLAALSELNLQALDNLLSEFLLNLVDFHVCNVAIHRAVVDSIANTALLGLGMNELIELDFSE